MAKATLVLEKPEIIYGFTFYKLNFGIDKPDSSSPSATKLHVIDIRQQTPDPPYAKDSMRTRPKLPVK